MKMQEMSHFLLFQSSMQAANMLAIYVASLRSLLTVSSPALPEALSNPSQNLHSFADFSA